MNNFNTQLLKLAYNHLLETNDPEFRFLPKNPKMFVDTLNSLEDLKNDGYIEVLSDNLYQTHFQLANNGDPSDATFVYRLTWLGKDFAKDL